MIVKLTARDLLAALDLHNKKVREAVRRGTLRGAHRARGILARATPVDTGQARAAWKVQDHSVAAAAGSLELATVENAAPYVGILEKGARPHKVSPAGWFAIYAWVVRHRAEFGFVTKSGRARRPRTTSTSGAGGPFDATGLDPTLAGITWAICHKLARKGQKPRYFVRDAMPRVQRALVREIVAELKDVERRTR